jgi:hypothetical protein
MAHFLGYYVMLIWRCFSKTVLFFFFNLLGKLNIWQKKIRLNLAFLCYVRSKAKSQQKKKLIKASITFLNFFFFAKKQLIFNFKDFSSITRHIEQTITDCMRTPGDFASLATHKEYKEQLCYIYWLVEDKLNDIGYVETLYASTRALSEAQPAYADPKFEATAKTLVLWYKMMSDLMARSDALGRFLGFTKRAEAKDFWPWFHDGLAYTRDEYLKTHSRIETWFEKQNNNRWESNKLYQFMFQMLYYVFLFFCWLKLV